MKLLPEDEVLKMIEGVPDVITGAVAKRKEFFDRIECPACGGKVQSEVLADDLRRMRADELVPYGRARCGSCGCLFDPDTKLVYERGSVTKLLEPAVTLINDKG